MKRIVLILFFVAGILLQESHAQITVKGTVFDSSGTYPVQAVSVLASNGSGTLTDARGDYSIRVAETDSIWFSYLNKPTRKFLVSSIKTPYAFNISLQTFVELLPGVKARVRDYKQDSIQNRRDYAKVFNYEKPGLKVSSLNDGTVGFDLTSIIESFQFRKNKRMAAFQNRLITEEQDAFIRHRFNKALIRRITQVDNDSTISQFIILYQPSFLFASTANDYTFHKYVKDSYDRFKSGLMPSPIWLQGATSDDSVIYRRFDQ
ncbi:carboxypeptidase-like regulatory domain-containing protein [Niabella ginsengisoli]|uniref:Carboxypeptidase-like regulatory domain-containing protein n=1 Tax=Niabella ginsengisoli TaxID=522298 RepID=A0ABS9SNA7_9BACT|nr:carboxypeptidase-like regulatory domain-containing protein [Niabella ginsengisoli]MCH5599756.1 carboxypeptidase-like regulatory domain-containing protein [Niabella ginsengisoli]